MVAKVTGGIVGVGLISTGGIAMAKPHWLGMDYMPGWHSLSDDNVFSSSSDYEDSKFGKKYGRYLVGPTHKKDKTQETNKSWWDWSFRRLEKTRHGKFSKVTHGYGTNKDTDLNKVCEEAYKQETNGLKTGSSPVTESEFKKEDVWKYCSPGLLTHTNQDETKYDQKTIGGETNNTSKLVSVKDNSNDWFWEIRNKDFWSTDSDWSGSKSAGDGGNESIFKKEYQANNANTNQLQKKTIKDLCKEAYEKEKGTSGNDKNNDDALKFCVLEAA